MENRQTIAFYLAKLPEQFYLYAQPYCLDQSFENYVLNFYRGYSHGNKLIAGVWGHVWNMKITIISPDTPDLKIFHDDDNFPDIVIVHKGRVAPEGHYFSTKMHNRSSKKLLIYGDNHSYKITELTDVKHHSKLAEEHYKEVKQQQCILDYNSAVDKLSELYDKIMQAKEEEMEVEEVLKKVKTARADMEKCVSAGTDHLLLAKAKLQSLGVSSSNLKKMKPITQGTQVETPAASSHQPASSLQPIVSIPEDESDIATRALIHSQITGSSVLEGASATYAGILPEGIIAAPMPSVGRRTTSTLVTSTSGTVPVASEQSREDIPVVLNVGEEVEVIAIEEEEENIPEGYKSNKVSRHIGENQTSKTYGRSKSTEIIFLCKLYEQEN